MVPADHPRLRYLTRRDQNPLGTEWVVVTVASSVCVGFPVDINRPGSSRYSNRPPVRCIEVYMYPDMRLNGVQEVSIVYMSKRREYKVLY